MEIVLNTRGKQTIKFCPLYLEPTSLQPLSNSARIFQPSPSTQATEKSSPPGPLSGSVGAEKPRCPKCNKTFANVGNKNRHVSSDCKFNRKREFPCRNVGCKRAFEPFTRKSYRDDHERERCKMVRRRQARDINDWAFS